MYNKCSLEIDLVQGNQEAFENVSGHINLNALL